MQHLQQVVTIVVSALPLLIALALFLVANDLREGAGSPD